MVKNPLASAEDAGPVPGLGRSLEEGMATHSSVLAWKIPWTEASKAAVHGVVERQTQLSTQHAHC